MNIDQSRIDQLVARPPESLNVEVKAWISPGDPSGVAKIVRAGLALRNRNGGYLIVGFNDKTLQPDLGTSPRMSERRFTATKCKVSYRAMRPTISKSASRSACEGAASIQLS